MSVSYYLVTSQYMGFFEYENVLNAANHIDEIIAAFSGLLWSIPVGILGLIALLLPSSNPKRKNYSLTVLPLLFICVSIVGLLYVKQSDSARGLPTQFTTLAYSMILVTEKVINTKSPVPKISITPKGKKIDGDIVFIMDESIRGDFLDVNSPNGVNTALEQFHDQTINFGIASSMTNCSNTNNVSMRYGISRLNYLHDIQYKPSMWQYAKLAGYKTSYIDAQLSYGKIGNHMSDTELSFIDNFIQIPNNEIPLYEKGILAAKKIVALLNNNVKDFIYVNKLGAHFPYEGKYPKSESFYAPTMDTPDMKIQLFQVKNYYAINL